MAAQRTVALLRAARPVAPRVARGTAEVMACGRGVPRGPSARVPPEARGRAAQTPSNRVGSVACREADVTGLHIPIEMAGCRPEVVEGDLGPERPLERRADDRRARRALWLPTREAIRTVSAAHEAITRSEYPTAHRGAIDP